MNRVGSDSSSMDNMLELMVTGGMDLFRGLRMIIPPAWQNVETMDADLRAFYEYNSLHMEPWDGPAGVVLTDGRYAVCLLDRNGLRPSRWVTTKNGYITLASEIGVWDYKPEDVIAKGRVGPGQILAVDTETGQVLHSDDIDNRLKSRHPYKQWLRQNALRIQATLDDDHGVASYDADQLKQFMKMFQVTFEERDQVLRPLGEQGQEAVGSMGDDTPMAILSRRIRSPYDYFRQQFAQVTNPPIDPLREAIVMSLETCLGVEQNIFEEAPHHANQAILTTPVISPAKWRTIMTLDRPGFDRHFIDLNYDESMGLEAAVRNIADQAEEAVRGGKVLLILSDRHIAPGKLPVHAALAVGAVHHRLVQTGLRCDSNILVETATARDPHHFAVLIGFGASAVYPFLAYEVLADLIRTGEVLGDLYEVFKYPQGDLQGPDEDSLEDGHLHRRVLPWRAAVRGGGPVRRGYRPVLHRSRQPHPGCALRRYRERAEAPGRRGLEQPQADPAGRLAEVRLWRRIPRLQPGCGEYPAGCRAAGRLRSSRNTPRWWTSARCR